MGDPGMQALMADPNSPTTTCRVSGVGSARRWHARSSIVALLLVVAACGSNGADDEGASRATYSSPVYGYSISHPRSWTVVDASRPLATGEPPATSSGAT